MIPTCQAVDAAHELCKQLEASGEIEPLDGEIPYLVKIAHVRHANTNYETLLEQLPECPVDCPIASAHNELSGAACQNYDLAHDILKSEARRVASDYLERKVCY